MHDRLAQVQVRINAIHVMMAMRRLMPLVLVYETQGTMTRVMNTACNLVFFVMFHAPHE